MSLNQTPTSERVHIAFFGKRNAGKSSVVNAVTSQNIAIVSEIAGTTTDPVYKAMELLPIGPVTIIDTPGIDDEGTLGDLRVKRAYGVLNKTDVAVLIVDGTVGIAPEDEALIERFKDKKINHIVVYNKSDLDLSTTIDVDKKQENEIIVSALNKENIFELKELITKFATTDDLKHKLIGDLIEPLDIVVLVIPIDSAAPKGRLILPQQQVVRDVLESDGIAVVTKETELVDTLVSLGRKPKMVVTDSQAFERVSKETPDDILLTSFSMLFARYKGDLDVLVSGTDKIDSLEDGDKVLICEGCTHHRQCDDIGTFKLPKWIEAFTGKKLNYSFTSGTEFPDDLSSYKLIIHCGSCMLNEREVKHRIQVAVNQNIPITNYGVLIAYMNGILDRTLQPFLTF